MPITTTDTPSPDTAHPRRALVALLLLVPAPTLGILVAL